MKYFSYLIALFINISAVGQINLVPNGNLEQGNGGAEPGCYNYYSGGGNCSSGFSTNNISCAERFDNDLAYWSVGHLNFGCLGDCFGSPDWTDPTCSIPGACASHGQNSRYVYMSSDKENIRVGLKKNGQHYTLIPGQKYIFEIRTRISSEIGGIRLIFSKWGEHWASGSNNNERWAAINANIHYNSLDAIELNCDWVFHRRTITVPTGTDYDELSNLIIQMENDVSNTSYTSIAVDDIALYEYEECQETRYIQDKIHWNENNIYQAGLTLIAGADVTPYPFDDIGDVVVKYNSEIIYRAGSQVILEPGFWTENGADFEAVIEPCNESPCNFPNLPDNEITLCNNTPIEIGHPPVTGLSYSWSPSTYLSNPNIANPIFSGPNSNGAIIYTVTMESICGGFLTPGGGPFGSPSIEPSTNYQFTVNYNPNPNPNPSITITNQIVEQNHVEFEASVAPETEIIVVQVINGSGQIIYTNTYSTTGIGCCPFNWSTDEMENSVWENINLCQDYQIKISTQNFCFPFNITEEVINWPRAIGNNVPPEILTQTNIIYLNGLGVECLAIETANADSYSIQIQPSGQVVIFEETGPITGEITCVWDGSCNMNVNTSLYCGNNGCADGGFSYFLTLTLANCHNLTTQDSWFTYLIYDPGFDCSDASGMMLWDGGEITEENVELREIITESFEDEESSTNEVLNGIPNTFIKEVSIFPNPNNGEFFAIIPNFNDVKIEVTDLSGKIVFSTTNLDIINKIELSHVAKGVYIVKIKGQENTITKKVIIN